MNLRQLIVAIRNEGYSQANAEARVCQDIVLKAIDESAFAVTALLLALTGLPEAEE